MRWHVHGTDALTGEDVELTVNEPQREQAIKFAISKNIVVSHVTSDAAGTWKMVLKPLAILTILGLVVAGGGLLSQNLGLRQSLGKAVDDQTRMAQSVATAERAAATIRSKGNLAEDAAAQIKKLADDLANARTGKALTEQQLSIKDRQIDQLEPAALRLPELEGEVTTLRQQLAAATALLKESERLRAIITADISLQSARIETLERLPTEIATTANANMGRLEAANAALATELEKIKDELLVVAAKAHAAETAPVIEAPPPAPVISWALRISYEDAQKFLALHTDPVTVTTRASAGTDQSATFTSSGALTDNALRVRFVHDREKEHVYSAAMIVPPTADAPAEKAAENVKLIASFLNEFVPGVREPESIVAAAMKQAATLNEEHRALFLVQDCKVQAWTTKAGLMTFQVDASRDTVEP